MQTCTVTRHESMPIGKRWLGSECWMQLGGNILNDQIEMRGRNGGGTMHWTMEGAREVI